MYKPLPPFVTIRKSTISGLGLFATETIPAGTYIGVIHVTNTSHPDGIIRTPLGGFGNHSDTPNCFKLKVGMEGDIGIATTHAIEVDEEITWKYTHYKITN